MRWILHLAVIGMILLSAALGQTQGDLLDRSYSGSSKEENPQAARKEITEKGAQIISEEVIQELIGEARYAKNKSTIQKKIISNSARYIPYVKPSVLNKENDEYKMSISMKVSLRDLRQLLQEMALLNENEAIPVVLPLISWVDRVEGRSYRWWQPLDKSTPPFLMKQSRVLEDSLRSAFQENDFYILKPVEAGLAAGIPRQFQNDRIVGEDAQFYAQYFNAPILLDGQVTLLNERGNRYRIEMRMTALQVSNGRAIADVARRFETDSGSFEGVVDRKLREVLEGAANDLAVQIREVWQRGSMGTSMVRVTIQGRHTLPIIESLKDKFRSITQIKNVRERIVTAESVTFEVDTSVSASDLLPHLQKIEIGGKKLAKSSAENEELILSWAR